MTAALRRAERSRRGTRLPDTVDAIVRSIGDAAGAGAQLLVLPEMATTGYDEAAILGTTPAQLASAEAEVCAAC